MRLSPKIWLFLGEKNCAPFCALFGQIRCAFEFRIIRHSANYSNKFKILPIRNKTMEDLYKIDKIEGKGFGWIALQDIKAGTLICKEKYQFVPKPTNDGRNLISISLNLMDTFYAMSENDQNEFLNLSNKYSDPNSLGDELKKEYFDLLIEIHKPEIEVLHFDTNFLLKIMGIHLTNGFGDGSFAGVNISHENRNFSITDS